MRHCLRPHPDTPPREIERVEVDTELRGGCVRLRYYVFGLIDALKLPTPAEQPDAEVLWRDTCFEMFARTAGSPWYDELNLSPSGKWIQFSFLAYREGREVLRTVVPDIVTSRRHDRFELTAYGALPEHGPWRLGLSAVIEEIDGTKSYWALAHAPGKPDFHHPDCFALELPAASAP